MYITGNTEKDNSYYDTVYAAGYNTSRYYPMYRRILEAVKNIESPRVLEIGCGVGDLGRMIVRESIPYRGFDFSEEAIVRCRQTCPQGDFRVGDAYENKNYLPHDYNVAIALEVLEHLDDLKVIANLPPGVHLFASVPDFEDVAHLRTYQDPQRDIVERFRPYLDVVDIIAMESINQATGQKMTIYIFHAVRKAPRNVAPVLGQESTAGRSTSAVVQSARRTGRNDPCYCGSGKKYKKCCLV